MMILAQMISLLLAKLVVILTGTWKVTKTSLTLLDTSWLKINKLGGGADSMGVERASSHLP